MSCRDVRFRIWTVRPSQKHRKNYKKMIITICVPQLLQSLSVCGHWQSLPFAKLPGGLHFHPSKPPAKEAQAKEATEATEADAPADMALPLALLARAASKQRAAAQLLDAWKISPSDLCVGKLIGSGGQADVYAGRWQGVPVAIKRARTSANSSYAVETLLIRSCE